MLGAAVLACELEGRLWVTAHLAKLIAGKGAVTSILELLSRPEDQGLSFAIKLKSGLNFRAASFGPVELSLRPGWTSHDHWQQGATE